MTKISGFRCDACGKVGNHNELTGWIVLGYMRDHDPDLGYSYTEDRKHACSFGCATDILCQKETS